MTNYRMGPMRSSAVGRGRTWSDAAVYYQEPGVEAELNFEFFESFHFIF